MYHCKVDNGPNSISWELSLVLGSIKPVGTKACLGTRGCFQYATLPVSPNGRQGPACIKYSRLCFSSKVQTRRLVSLLISPHKRLLPPVSWRRARRGKIQSELSSMALHRPSTDLGLFWSPGLRQNPGSSASGPLPLLIVFSCQPSLGHGDQGCHAEVPKPDEPVRGGRGRAGAQCGRLWAPAQSAPAQY